MVPELLPIIFLNKITLYAKSMPQILNYRHHQRDMNLYSKLQLSHYQKL